MFKAHLKDVHRKLNTEKKSEFNIVLSQNERNLNFEDEFFNKFLASIKQENLRFYPDTTHLKTLLAANLNTTTDNILITPGSDIAIKTLFEAIEFGNGHVLTTDYHFPMYSVYSQLYNIPIEFVNYTPDLDYSIQDLVQKVDKHTKFIILANPNSPLGTFKSYEDLQPLLDLGIPVLIDEAYIELTTKETLIEHIQSHENLFISRTFSKGLGAAGARVGYIVSSKSNIEILNKFRFMYETSGIGTKFAEYLLENSSVVDTYLDSTLEGKKKLVEIIRKKEEVLDTDASWFFIKEAPKLKSIFLKNKVSYRTIQLPGRDSTFIKFNYDLSIENTTFLNEIING